MNIAAHDLRTPATAIKGFAQMIRQGEFGPAPTGELGEAVASIEEGVDRMISLINDFLTISRTERNKFSLHLGTVNLNECVTEALKEITLTTQGRPIELIQEVDSQLHAIQGDQPKVMQVIINLLDNALKHTESGSITVRAATFGMLSASALISLDEK